MSFRGSQALKDKLPRSSFTGTCAAIISRIPERKPHQSYLFFPNRDSTNMCGRLKVADRPGQPEKNLTT